MNMWSVDNLCGSLLNTGTVFVHQLFLMSDMTLLKYTLLQDTTKSPASMDHVRKLEEGNARPLTKV